jgi:hypothetical protein
LGSDAFASGKSKETKHIEGRHGGQRIMIDTGVLMDIKQRQIKIWRRSAALNTQSRLWHRSRGMADTPQFKEIG